jgi:RNA polymerase sigma-70 factor (sigma-E family)
MDDTNRAFAQYYAARRETVRRTAYLLCGQWDWADDLTQIAFVRVALAWSRIRDPAAIDAFTRTCLMRAYLSERRRSWRRWERALEPGDDVATATGDLLDLRLTLMQALKTLAPRQRATLVWRYFQGLDVQQTAEVMGCSTGNVKSQTARALATLRRVLGPTAIDLPDLEVTR